jgi:hypothetical protein
MRAGRRCQWLRRFHAPRRRWINRIFRPADAGCSHHRRTLFRRSRIGKHTDVGRWNTYLTKDGASKDLARFRWPYAYGAPDDDGLHASEDSPVIVEITDPIAGYRYTLDTQGKVAHRLVIAPPPAIPPQQRKAITDATARQGASQPAPGGGLVGSFSTIPRRIVSQRESLGTKLIDGIPVQGTKWIHTIPAGAQGNDHPMSTVRESWYSSELREMIESTSSDPRNGVNIMRLTNIDRNNPDPSLFQVPADYEIVDEKGPFSINYHQ